MGTKSTNTSKDLGLPCLLVELSFLGETGVAGTCWVWGESFPRVAGTPLCLPLGQGCVADNQGILTAEINMWFKVNENS